MFGVKSSLSLALLVALAAPLVAAGLDQPQRSPVERLLETGLSAFQSGDHVAANGVFRKLASQDVPAAETLLGTMAANGQGGPKDDAVAAAWFLRAARQGYAPAQMALADAFLKGRGVAPNPDRAMALAKAAAAQEYPGAAQWIARHSPPVLALSGASNEKSDSLGFP